MGCFGELILQLITFTDERLKNTLLFEFAEGSIQAVNPRLCQRTKHLLTLWLEAVMVLDQILDQDAFSKQPTTERTCLRSRSPQLLRRWWDLLFSHQGVKYREESESGRDSSPFDSFSPKMTSAYLKATFIKQIQIELSYKH